MRLQLVYKILGPSPPAAAPAAAASAAGVFPEAPPRILCIQLGHALPEELPLVLPPDHLLRGGRRGPRPVQPLMPLCGQRGGVDVAVVLDVPPLHLLARRSLLKSPASSKGQRVGGA